MDLQGTAQSASAGSRRWREGWIGWRNRIIASPRFQHWVARLPLLRRVARRRAVRAFDLLAGFCYSQVLFGAAQVGLLGRLAEGASDLAGLARATTLPEEAVLRLVRAAAALDLAQEVRPGRWMLGQQGAALQANPGALAMVRHHALLYADLADPAALLRSNRAAPTALSRFWHYAGAGDDGADRAAADYSALMATSQALVAGQALGAYRFARHRRVLDVGGGHGAFAIALARACPRLEIGLFDLPPVMPGAATALQQAGLAERVQLHPGSFLRDPLPTGYDAMTLVRILHDHDDERCLGLLRAIRQALGPGGRLVIAEPTAGTPGATAMGDAYFGMYLWAMNSGRPRSVADYRLLLQKAGFSRSWHAASDLPVIASIVVSLA